MSKVYVVAFAAMMIAVSAALTVHVSADEKMTIKEVMEKAHKGKESPVQTVIQGKADEALLKQFIAYYTAMGAQKPPKGDESAWKKKCDALVQATQGLIDKKPNADVAFKAAVDCKGCHTDFKPAKKDK